MCSRDTLALSMHAHVPDYCGFRAMPAFMVCVIEHPTGFTHLRRGADHEGRHPLDEHKPRPTMDIISPRA